MAAPPRSHPVRRERKSSWCTPGRQAYRIIHLVHRACSNDVSPGGCRIPIPLCRRASMVGAFIGYSPGASASATGGPEIPCGLRLLAPRPLLGFGSAGTHLWFAPQDQ